MPQNNMSGNNLLISLAGTVAVGYLTTRYRLFRSLWRFMPLLVVISAWMLNRQAEHEHEQAEEVAEAAA